MSDAKPRCAVVGGSGLYALAGMEDVEELQVRTPFGPTSDVVRIGSVAGRRVAFLARHGSDHRLLPGEINYRANIFALKHLGVERIVSVAAVGSMAEKIRPRDVVLVDQFIDRTTRRESTFFGGGIAAHVSLADPVCPEARSVLVEAARAAGATVHDGGTYVCIEGPGFSTRAESRLHRSWGVDVVGMTNLPEARLAREAELCYATLALVTDYDSWREDLEAVTVSSVLENLRANGERAAQIVCEALRHLPDRGSGCSCGDALRNAIITPPQRVAPAVRERLRPILGKYLDIS